MTDFREQLRQAWIEEHGHAPTWVDEMLIDTYAEHMDAAMGRIIGDTENTRLLGFLGAAEPAVETEEQRVARELVPLVRAAAGEAFSPRPTSKGGSSR